MKNGAWAVLVAFVVFVALAPSATAASCSASPGQLEGVDVSHYQGSIDFAQVRASGRTFVYARASDGLLYKDPSYDAYHSQATAAGLAFGAYQFFEPAQDAAQQAAAFLADAHLAAGDLVPVLDVEVTGGQADATIKQGVATWLAVVGSALGVKPLIYTGASFWNAHLGMSGFAAQGSQLFVALYAAQPVLPTEWSSWTLWQYSANGAVPGITGGVDVDHFAGGDLCTITVQSVPGPPVAPATVPGAGATQLTPAQSPATPMPPPPPAPPRDEATELGLPAAHGCLSRRRLTVHVHAPLGQRLASFTVTVNRRRAPVKHHSSVVDLVGLPKGTFSVTITEHTAAGKTLHASRRYRTCAPKHAH